MKKAVLRWVIPITMSVLLVTGCGSKGNSGSQDNVTGSESVSDSAAASSAGLPSKKI